MGVYTTPASGLHEPSTHGLDVLMTGGGCCTQLPLPSQSKAPRHWLVLPHAVPDGAAGFEQLPFDGLHVPAVWHASAAVQVTATPAQAPAVHTSSFVHGLSSLQAVPFPAAGFEQTPVDGLQAPATWH